MLPILLATYVAVFMAEIVGDKLLYTTGLLATRYKTLPILCGMALAFMLKMGVAVAVGQLISTLPKWLVATITAVNFFAIAVVLWRKKDKREVTAKNYPAPQAALVAFAAIFFSEWGDVGQITAANAAASAKLVTPPVPHVALVVWLGAVAAMVTKGTLASFIGGGVRGWLQSHFEPKTLRYAATALLIVLGLFSVWEILFENEGPAVLLYFMR
jgi:putative Ca2+/H+ antiporter (TMEM165/GDT1 family)